MPCPPHPAELADADADRTVRRIRELQPQVAQARRHAKALIDLLEGRTDVDREALDAAMRQPALPKWDRRRPDPSVDGWQQFEQDIRGFVTAATSHAGTLEERLCVWRTAFARLDSVGPMPAALRTAQRGQLRLHRAHRLDERKATLRHLRALLRAAGVHPGDAAHLRCSVLRREIARVEAIEVSTLLVDRRCLASRV